MPRRSAKDGFARVQELAAFDQKIALSFLAERTSASSSDVLNVSAGGLEQTISVNPLTAQLPSFPSLAGFDEAGRGALAGPVVVGCVHFPSFVELRMMSRVASELVSDVALFGLCDNVADELPRYETKARSSVVSESHPHIGQAVSDLLLTQQPALLHDPAVASELVSDVPLAKGKYSSPDDSILRSLAGIDDSKRLTAKQREALLPRIKTHAMWGVGAASAGEIDKLGIVPAVSLAARRAYRAMGIEVAILLCDRGITVLKDPQIEPVNHLIARTLESPINRSRELSFTRGDSRSLHIAAASIIAKVTRDQMMIDLDRHLPGYDFAAHKGYGTAAHISALRELGPSRAHRRSFHVK